MIDTALMFMKDQLITSGHTSEAIDLGQVSPDLGMVNTPELHVTIQMTEAFTGGSSPKVTFELQDCDQKSGTYRTIATTGQLDANDAVGTLDLVFPIQHRQFLKLKVTTTGTPSTGKCFAAITDGSEKNPYYEREI